MNGDKPPLGLRPKFIAYRLRVSEICEAIIRYVSHGQRVPRKWRKELNVLLKNRGDYERR